MQKKATLLLLAFKANEKGIRGAGVKLKYKRAFSPISRQVLQSTQRKHMTPVPNPNHSDLEAIKTLVPLAVPAIKQTIEGWLAPAIAKLAKSKEILKNSKPEQIEKAFEEYLLRA